ncbi:hypothetical protein [Azohydromonas lata]|uniref:Uncharacterized protein n=1 Tax=Azohydromonas lata TaxID=45677 RepID=A0ABU5INF1_9BURK|nr:hypothetical protein [Azohydromonas lata]MDZ5460431.1 hypothetical protein [Azohydromonas lata]
MPTKKIVAGKKAAAPKTTAKAAAKPAGKSLLKQPAPVPRKAAPVAKKAAPVAKQAAPKAVQPVAATTFRLKVELAKLADGATTFKQLARAVGKLAQTLAKMDEAGGVKLEQPVGNKVAHLATQDAKLARRFGMEEGRAPRGAAAPVAQKAAAKKAAVKAPAPAPAPAEKAPAKKAAAKKAAAKAAPVVEAAAPAPAPVAAPAPAPAKKPAARKAARKKAAPVAAQAAADVPAVPSAPADETPAS